MQSLPRNLIKYVLIKHTCLRKKSCLKTNTEKTHEEIFVCGLLDLHTVQQKIDSSEFFWQRFANMLFITYSSKDNFIVLTKGSGNRVYQILWAWPCNFRNNKWEMRIKSKNYQNSTFFLVLQHMLNLPEYLPLVASCLDLGYQVKYVINDPSFSAMI